MTHSNFGLQGPSRFIGTAPTKHKSLLRKQWAFLFTASQVCQGSRKMRYCCFRHNFSTLKTKSNACIKQLQQNLSFWLAW